MKLPLSSLELGYRHERSGMTFICTVVWGFLSCTTLYLVKTNFLVSCWCNLGSSRITDAWCRSPQICSDAITTPCSSAIYAPCIGFLLSYAIWCPVELVTFPTYHFYHLCMHILVQSGAKAQCHLILSGFSLSPKISYCVLIFSGKKTNRILHKVKNCRVHKFQRQVADSILSYCFHTEMSSKYK